MGDRWVSTINQFGLSSKNWGIKRIPEIFTVESFYKQLDGDNENNGNRYGRQRNRQEWPLFFFAWEACREYILTINMLKRRGKCMVNRCFMCKLIRNYVAWMSTDLQILDNDLRIFGNKLGNSWFGESWNMGMDKFMQKEKQFYAHSIIGLMGSMKREIFKIFWRN